MFDPAAIGTLRIRLDADKRRQLAAEHGPREPFEPRRPRRRPRRSLARLLRAAADRLDPALTDATRAGSAP